MKKVLSVILICMMLIAYTTCVNASSQDIDAQSGFLINFNGMATGYTSVICNDKHYVPMRKVFEMMEAIVFYRDRDSKVLALSRDGDTLIHVIGDKKITVNGLEKIFDFPSLEINNETYIPVDMLSAALCPDRIFYDNRQQYYYSAYPCILNAGTLELKGNVTHSALRAEHGLNSSGTHKIIFSGDKKQIINIWSGTIDDLIINNTSDEGIEIPYRLNVNNRISQPIGTPIINEQNVKLGNKKAFVDYGNLNTKINKYNNNAENVIPTWLDYEKYCNFALDGDKVFTLNESITNTSFDCDLYFSDDYNKSSATVIIAFYDGYNRFVQIASKSVDVKEGKIDVSINYENKPYSKYKIMVWEGLDNLKPLMKVE